MLLKPENSTDTNELFECHGEYYLELAKGTPYGDANFIKEDIAIYKKYLNPKRKTNSYRTQDLIFINRVMNELRIHIKKYLHDRHGLKKGGQVICQFGN